MTTLLELSQVSKTFKGEPPVCPLLEVDLQVGAGELVAVTGVSGKGKSTLLNVAGGLLKPDTGHVRFKGEDLYEVPPARLDALHRTGLGFIFQTPYLFQALTARENLLFAQKTQAGSMDERRVDELLQRFGLTERAGHLPCELSVGQKRRLVIARSFLADHAILLADEPTNDLDEGWSNIVFDEFGNWIGQGDRAVVVVTHDETYARRAGTVYLLDDGRLARRQRG